MVYDIAIPTLVFSSLIVDLRRLRIMIFHSYVSLPTGKQHVNEHQHRYGTIIVDFQSRHQSWMAPTKTCLIWSY